MKRAMLLVLLSFSVFACTVKEKEKIIVIPADEPEAEADKNNSPDRNKVRAEKLVVSAEELITPIGFMLADQLLDMALKNDPDNRKAQFYKALVGPIMKYRGLLSRLTPLRPSFISVFEKLSSAGGALGEFLRDRNGGPAFTNENDLQKFLGEIQKEQKKLADFIAKNKTFITRLSVSHVYDFDKMIRECSVHKISANTYRLTPCTHMQQLQLRVNRGDWEVMFQLANSARMGAATLLSYNLEGSLAYYAKHKEFKTTKSQVEYLAQAPRFGKILADHQMELVKDRSIDTYTGMKWLLNTQPQLCSVDSPRNEHLFKRICLNKAVSIGPVQVGMAQGIDLMRMSIGGNGGKVKALVPRPGFSGNDVSEINMDLLALYKFPVDDLRTLVPKTFDGCGNATSLNDPTFGGTFPAGNADELLLKRKDCYLDQPGPR